MSEVNTVEVLQQNTLVVVGGAQQLFLTRQALPSNGPIGGSKALVHATGGTVGLASADNVTHRGLLAGISVNAVSGAGQAVEFRRQGEFIDTSWTWTPKQPVYVGLNGALTQTHSAAWSWVCVVGIATSPTSIDVNFQPVIAQN